jgi:hypothetical protein
MRRSTGSACSRGIGVRRPTIPGIEVQAVAFVFGDR